jgi:predicted ATPase
MAPKGSLDWSSITQKLYGREEDTRKLEKAYRRCISMDSPLELVMITGPSGTGKTALARTLLPMAETKGGFFISGKFDQLERNENYYPIVNAFSEYVTKLSQRDEATIEEIKVAIGHLTDTERVLLDMIPALEQFVGTKDDKTNVTGAGAQKRLTFAFREFVQAICSPERPLVLFLDDLQWADPASLDILSALVYDTKIQGLMVLGACRGNEVSMDHHLAVTLREMEAESVAITDIQVANLDIDAINTMLSNTLHLSMEESEPLAELVCRQTCGNVFYAIQLLRSLSEEGLLYQDIERERWAWESEDKIIGKLKCSSVIQLVAEKIQRLPRDALDVLMVASCLGAEFDEYLLHEVVTSDVPYGIAIAEEKGLIERSCAGWRFVHDQIQQSAYSLIPEYERGEVHLQIGRKLWSSLGDTDELGLNTFLVVNQLRHGAHLIKHQGERDRMAVLLLRAGEKATKSSAFQNAASHLNLGISMLGNRHWRDQYHLSLDLYNATAEVEYCNANFDRMDELINEVLKNARCTDDKTRALTTSIYSLGSRNELQKALDLGFKVLADLGEPFPATGRTLTIVFEFMKTKRMLRNLSDDDILNLPRMYDTRKLAAMRIMILLFTYSVTGRPTLAPLIAFRLVQATLSHGLSGMASNGFACVGMLLCVAFGDIDLGIRLARVSIRILDKFQANEWVARVYTATYGFCFPCEVSVKEHLKPLLISHRVGLGSGDIEFAMLSASHYTCVALNASVPLPQLLSDMRSFLGLMKLHKQTNMIQFLLPNMQFALNMMGHSKDPLVLTGEVMIEDRAMHEAVTAQNYACIALLHCTKLHISSYFQDYEMAECSADALAKYKKEGSGTFPRYLVAAWQLHEGLAAVTLCSQRSRRRMRTTRRNIKTLRAMSCHDPAVCLNKLFLLEAEVAAANGKVDEALTKFEQSISHAQKGSLLNETGLACERAAMFLKRHGKEIQAMPFLERALSAYEQWGACAKVAAIKKILPVTLS